MLPIVNKRKIWYTVSVIVVVASLLFVAIKGMRLGIDFTGGSLLEITYTEERVSPEQINTVLQEVGISSVTIQSVDDKGYLMRFPEIGDDTRRDIMSKLREQIGQTEEESRSLVTATPVGGGAAGGEVIMADVGTESINAEGEVDSSNKVIEQRFESIGPVIGQELKGRSIRAIIIVLIAILIYVAYAFRKVSWPVKSWKYGLIALVTLFHDVTITLGVFTAFSYMFGWEMNSAFVAAILTILGYSVNDTIVVFDRIRENVPRSTTSFADTVNLSVNQTISRSINTSITTLLVLFAILIIGGTSIQSFIAALIVGVSIGTYSSIFIASPLLVSSQLSQRAKTEQGT